MEMELREKMGKIYNSIKESIRQAKIGRVWVKGNYSFMISDPVAQCRSALGLEPSGLIPAGCVYSNFWNERGIDGEICLLRSPLIRRKIKVLGQGSTRFNISKKEILKLTVEIPSLEEQKKIITLLENLTNTINFMKNKNSKIKEFKKYLLQQMFV